MTLFFATLAASAFSPIVPPAQSRFVTQRKPMLAAAVRKAHTVNATATATATDAATDISIGMHPQHLRPRAATGRRVAELFMQSRAPDHHKAITYWGVLAAGLSASLSSPAASPVALEIPAAYEEALSLLTELDTALSIGMAAAPLPAEQAVDASLSAAATTATSPEQLVPVAAAALLVATPRLLAPYSRALRVHQLRAQRQIARLAEKSGNYAVVALLAAALISLSPVNAASAAVGDIGTTVTTATAPTVASLSHPAVWPCIAYALARLHNVIKKESD